MMHQQRKRFPVRYVLAAVPVLLVVIIVTQFPYIRPPLPQSSVPPRLSYVTSHHARPRTLPSTRPEWKRPRVLTAHATRSVDKTTLNVAIFTTGTDTQSYGRTFKVVGCKIGDRVYRPLMTRPEVTICEVEASDPIESDIVTVLLRVDETLKRAMSGPETLSREVFEMQPADVQRVNVTLEGEKDVAVVASDLRWSNHLVDVYDPSQPRHELCLMTAMKQYPYLLEGWAEYYRRAGVDQMFVYDNFADTDIKSYMSKYDFVQVIFWPWTRSQMQSFTHFVRASRARCKYVAFFDADEYIMVGASGRSVLKQYVHHRMVEEKYKQVVSHFIMFLNNGYVKRPLGDLPKLYTRRQKDQPVSLGKAIIDTDHKFHFHKIHMVEGMGTKTYWNTTLELEPKSVGHNAMLMHYTERSWEENVLKKKYGGSSPMTTYRKPLELDVNKPDKGYMDKSKTVPFDGFVKRYEAVMRERRPQSETLVWRTEDGRQCSRSLCRRCWTGQLSEQRCR